MIDQWLNYAERNPNTYKLFRLIDVSEKQIPDAGIKEYLGKELIASYRSLDFLKFQYEHESEAILREYIKNYVFPTDTYQIAKNVRQGDFAEVLAGLIVSHFQNLTVPLQKLRWKFNSDRSVFCTDMIAHNTGNNITDLYYYEIKSRLDIKKEVVGKDPASYVTVNAHNSLLKDEHSPNEGIADFLTRYYFELNDFKKAAQYSEIVKTPQNFNRNFELFFVIEHEKYIAAILDDLENLPPTLKPLSTTIVLIKNIKSIVEEAIQHATNHAVAHVYTA